jgi:hypothetical protein
MDNNFAEFLTTGGWNTPTHFLERRLILSVVKVWCTRYTHSLHPHCTHKVENAKGKGCIPVRELFCQLFDKPTARLQTVEPRESKTSTSLLFLLESLLTSDVKTEF